MVKMRQVFTLGLMLLNPNKQNIVNNSNFVHHQATRYFILHCISV